MRRVLFAAFIVTGLAACSDLTRPTRANSEPAPAGSAEAVPGEIKASHILIQYQGSSRAGANVTRDKAAARQFAEALLTRAKSGEDFKVLARKNSDEPGASARAGSLGSFGKGSMVKPFEDAAFALKPGELSPIVETPFGFHVIRRDP